MAKFSNTFEWISTHIVIRNMSVNLPEGRKLAKTYDIYLFIFVYAHLHSQGDQSRSGSLNRQNFGYWLLFREIWNNSRDPIYLFLREGCVNRSIWNIFPGFSLLTQLFWIWKKNPDLTSAIPGEGSKKFWSPYLFIHSLFLHFLFLSFLNDFFPRFLQSF